MPYRTAASAAEFSVTIEKSEFIARISPVVSSEEAAAFIDSVRAEHRRARHNCYAYSLREGFETRFSDDGEPQGTAGPPILDVITKNGLADVCIVVTRYFGEILLGKGGLVRAYSSAAAGAVSAAGIKTMREARAVRLSFDYTYYDRVLRLISGLGVKTVSQDFADRVVMELWCREENCRELSEALTALSGGNIPAEFSEPFFADLE